MQTYLGKFYLFWAFVLAGTSVITVRFVSDYLGSFTITATTLGIFLLIYLPIRGHIVFKTLRTFNKKTWIIMGLQALLGIFLFRILLFTGLNYTSASEAGILTGVAPAITALMAYYLLKEPVTKAAIIGIGCTVLGITLLQGLGAGDFKLGHLWGNILVLMAATSESSFNIIARLYSVRDEQLQLTHITPITQTIIVSGIAFVLCLIPTMGERPLSALQTLGITQWLALLWYALGVTALAFVCFYAGIKRCGAYTAAAFSGLMPLTALLLSILLLRETLENSQVLGATLIIGGILLIAKQRNDIT